VEHFCQVAYTLWHTVGELFLPIGCVSPRYVDSDSDKHPTIICPIVLPTLSQFIVVVVVVIIIIAAAAAVVIILCNFVTGHCAVKLAL